jgi:class 3 adenylate cyclase
MEPQNFERRLTTILSADAVGYSWLMTEDEEGTLDTLGVYRNTMAELVGEHGGRNHLLPAEELVTPVLGVADKEKSTIAGGCVDALDRRRTEEV